MARLPTLLRSLLGATLLCLSLPAPAAQSNTIIVLDASNSMWGQVDGVAKIEIARDVFADLLGDWGEKGQLGVIAYGHRRKGDCADIEQIIEVGPVDAKAAIARIRGILPKGRTPLTDAVQQAAEALRYEDTPATVILLTDGIETCDRDPCQLATALERAGVAFTAHVVGFDVAAADRPKIACIAENTGGRFLAAANAVELNQAMREVTVEAPPPAPAPAPIKLVALDAETGAALPGALWRVVAAGDANPVGDGQGASLTLDLDPGDYQVSATLNEANASQRITVVAGRPATHELRIAIPLPEATLSAPETAPAGSVVDVDWIGPNAYGDGVVIVAPDTPVGQQFQVRPTSAGNPAKVRAPDALGPHEIRYYSRSLKRILATRPIELTPVSATLEAPDQAPAGSGVEVHWTGPNNPQDYITIVEPGAPEGSFKSYRETSTGSPVTLTAPDAIGPHELRYVISQSKRTLASRPIELVPVAATLDAPPEVPAGSQIEVRWTGPDNRGDYITVVEQGAPEGTYTKYADTERGSPANLLVPDALGDYEVRYVVGQSKRTLASRPVRLMPVVATLEAPAEVPAGSQVEVRWTGPANRGDYITVVEQGAPEGTYTKYVETSRGSPATIQVPDALGDHEVRYVVGQSKRTLTSRPVRLMPVVATLEAPAEVPAGGTIKVHWSGPDNKGDYITVVEKGAPEGVYTKYVETGRGSPATVQVPDALGDYEVRYVVGQSKRTLASEPVKLVPIAAALRVDGPVLPGALFEVHWSGPDNKRDYVTIVEPGAPEGSHTSYQDTKRGNPVSIKAPDAPGDYEVRYVVGQSKRTLASLPVKVGADAVTLSVPGSVGANGVVEVTFSGPGRYEDQIEIVATGSAADAKPLRSARASQGSPLKLFAPPTPGTYDLRYRMTDTGTVLAKVPLTVE